MLYLFIGEVFWILGGVVIDRAEQWLRNNDPNFSPTRRRRLEYPYLTIRQLLYRIGFYGKTGRKIGKEVPLSNLMDFREELGFKERKGDSEKKVLELLEYMD